MFHPGSVACLTPDYGPLGCSKEYTRYPGSEQVSGIVSSVFNGVMACDTVLFGKGESRQVIGIAVSTIGPQSIRVSSHWGIMATGIQALYGSLLHNSRDPSPGILGVEPASGRDQEYR
jgi:hypothetical protein